MVIIRNLHCAFDSLMGKPSALRVYTCSERRLYEKLIHQSTLVGEGLWWQGEDQSLAGEIKEASGWPPWAAVLPSESGLYLQGWRFLAVYSPTWEVYFAFNKTSLLMNCWASAFSSLSSDAKNWGPGVSGLSSPVSPTFWISQFNIKLFSFLYCKLWLVYSFQPVCAGRQTWLLGFNNIWSPSFFTVYPVILSPFPY